jgi:alkyl hydroperoxide reductase subunit AhpC
MVRGVTQHLRRPGICISRYSPILNPRAPLLEQYGAYRAADGICERALFVIDKKGTDRVELLFADCC